LALLHDGRFIADGKPADVLTADRLEAVYRTPVRVHDEGDGTPRVSLVR